MKSSKSSTASRICRKCEKDQPLDQFHVSGKGTPDSVCKECRKLEARERRRKETEAAMPTKAKTYDEMLFNRILTQQWV